MAVREVLTGYGLTAETAEAVMNAYARQGDDLTVADARALVRDHLDAKDPEAAALVLLADLAGDGGRRQRRQRKPADATLPTALTALKGFREGDTPEDVRPADDPDLFEACVLLMRELRGEDWRRRGEWGAVTFPAEIVATAREHMRAK